MPEYKTIEGDVVDQICKNHYGTEHGTTEAVLMANHDLASYTGRLPAGLIIQLPEIEQSDEIQLVRLWQ